MLDVPQYAVALFPYSDGVAWRLTFIVPLIITMATGVAMLLQCPDTPTGKWSERHLHANRSLASDVDNAAFDNFGSMSTTFILMKFASATNAAKAIPEYQKLALESTTIVSEIRSIHEDKYIAWTDQSYQSFA
ncbi:hypothetical protein F5Y05DRAFT_411989 [Hypoxylon sp. FL0543]|nr:hypothetical protein F5Y05DRAFT_411989 [Hypoxylon sp. FL0543]